MYQYKKQDDRIGIHLSPSRLEQIRMLSPVHLQLIYHLQDKVATQGMVSKYHYYCDECAQDMGLKNTRLYW